MPLFDHADLVVAMDVPWRVAGYRILARHVKAELRRDNRFPGWRSLVHFWRWSHRHYHDRNTDGLNAYGAPGNLSHAREVISRYRNKTVFVRTDADLSALLGRLPQQSGPG